MIFRSHAARLFGVAFALGGVGVGVPKAIAQTTYPFEANYNTQTILRPIAPNISEATVTGESTDAPYGLTKLDVRTYSQLDPNTGAVTFNADPATFGLDNLPVLFDTILSTDDGEQLFTITSDINAAIDFENQTLSGSGIQTVTGGTGRFAGATGELSFIQTDILSPDPTAPSGGQAFVTGSFETPQAVPEPRTEATLAVIGALGASFLMRRHHQRTM
jgi:hypothetical protein